VSEAVAADPSHYVVSGKKWVDATEEMIEAAAAHFESLGGLAEAAARGGTGGGQGAPAPAAAEGREGAWVAAATVALASR
jgi:hypothetical protein